MSFGYGISDFLAFSKLAWDVVQNSSKACGAHAELTREAKSLHVVLQRLELEVAKPESLLNRKDDNQREELVTLCSDCNAVLRVLNRILEKYNALSEEERSVKKLWQKIRFGNGEMQDLNEIRLKISTSTQALNLFFNMLSIGSQGRVEQYMDTQGPELKDIKSSVNWIAAMLQAKTPGEGSVLTSYADDEKAFWKEFRRELVKEGFPSSVISKHKSLIMKYVMELGSRGAMDDLQPGSELVTKDELSSEDDMRLSKLVISSSNEQKAGHDSTALGLVDEKTSDPMRLTKKSGSSDSELVEDVTAVEFDLEDHPNSHDQLPGQISAIKDEHIKNTITTIECGKLDFKEAGQISGEVLDLEQPLNGHDQLSEQNLPVKHEHIENVDTSVANGNFDVREVAADRELQ